MTTYFHFFVRNNNVKKEEAEFLANGLKELKNLS